MGRLALHRPEPVLKTWGVEVWNEIPVVRVASRLDWKHIPGTGKAGLASLPAQNTSQWQELHESKYLH